MSAPLPHPWVDTSIVRSFDVSCTIRLVNLPATAGTGEAPAGIAPPPGILVTQMDANHPWLYGDVDTPGVIGGDPNMDVRIAGNHWSRPRTQTDPTPVYNKIVYLIAGWLPPPRWVEIERVAGLAAPANSNTYTFVATLTGARLGVKRGPIFTSPPPVPSFWNNYELVYQWFLDGESTLFVACAGHSSGTLHWMGQFGSWLPANELPPPNHVPNTTQTPTGYGSPGQILVRGHGTAAGAFTPPVGADKTQVEFRSITSDGVLMDTADVNDNPGFPYQYLFPMGAGGLDVRVHQGLLPSDYMAAPYRFAYDLGITKFGIDDLHARVTDNFLTPVQIFIPDGTQKTPQANYLETPASPSYVVQVTGHQRRTKQILGPLFFDLEPAWAGGQNPPINADDRQVPIYGAPAMSNPAVVTPYFPLDWKVLPLVDVHRPNGLRPSDWVALDPGKITVEEGASSVFNVAATGGSVKRTLLTHWRNRTTVGDPLFGIEHYEITRHNYFGSGDDVWGWQHHGWLRWLITSPAVGAHSLTCTVRGVHFEVFDPHTTGEDRIADYTRTETPFTVTYPLPLTDGENTVFMDLLFPESGPVPFYYGRVDSIELSEFQVGIYAVNGIDLRARHDGYIKNELGRPVPRTDYDAIVWAQDGAFCLGNWSDRAIKTELGTVGGGVRTIQILTGSGTGEILDQHRSLEAFGTDLHKLEGMEAVYSISASIVANQDIWGSRLSPELAQDIWSIAPFDYLPLDANYKPACSPRVRRLAITPGQEFRLLVRWPLWAAIEVLVTQSGGRAPAGIVVGAVRTDTGVTVATAMTDESGYAIIHPVPGDLTYQIVELARTRATE